MERIDKGKGKEVVEMEYNSEQSKMVIEDGGDGMERVEEVVGTLALFVWFNGVEKNFFFLFIICFE